VQQRLSKFSLSGWASRSNELHVGAVIDMSVIPIGGGGHGEHSQRIPSILASNRIAHNASVPWDRSIGWSGTGLGSWRVPLNDLTRFTINDFGPFSRLCGGSYSPLRFDEQMRSYQPPALHANLIYDFRWP
jgi:hypothetical protein